MHLLILETVLLHVAMEQIPANHVALEVWTYVRLYFIILGTLACKMPLAPLLPSVVRC